MTRFENFKLLNGTHEILGKPEIKTSLSAKEIYWVNKLNNKLTSENKRTGAKQNELTTAKAQAFAKEGITPEQKGEVEKQFNDDWQAIWDEEVPNVVDVKIAFERAEKILQHLTKSDVTSVIIEYLLTEPQE